MKVYELRAWDPMASSMGDDYQVGIYATRESAQAVADKMNASKAAYWAKTPAGMPGGKDWSMDATVYEKEVK